MSNITYVVAVGDAFEGLKLYGPFDTIDEARTFGQLQKMVDWRVVRLEKP